MKQNLINLNLQPGEDITAVKWSQIWHLILNYLMLLIT